MKTGFTIIEMAIVIVILSILAVFALARYVDLTSEAERAAEIGVVGRVRSGISIYYADSALSGTPVFPAELGSSGGGEASPGNPLFTYIMAKPVVSQWEKSGFSYTGPAENTYTYDPDRGTFLLRGSGGNDPGPGCETGL